MANQGLSVNDVVNVTTYLSPTAAPLRNFGADMIIGDSQVIDTNERIRQYSSITGVANDFGTTAPEYLAAVLFFQQSPQPSFLYIARWASTASTGSLHGAVLTPTQQLISNFNAITAGGFTIYVDNTVHALSGLNFSSAVNLNGVASIIATALPSANVFWNSNYSRFEIYSKTTGSSSNVTYASGDVTGTAAALGLLSSSGASVPVAGMAAETLLSCVTLLSTSSLWYGAWLASTVVPNDAALGAVSAFIEAASPSRVWGISTQEPAALDPTQTTDIASVSMSNNYTRTMVQYSSASPYAVGSLLGRFATVNYQGTNTVITGKFQQEPGIVAEYINETQAATLNAKNCNVFVNYNNSTAIIQQGVMSSGMYIDERMGIDWLQNYVQTNLYNLLYTVGTKIPQTDAGVHQLVTNVQASCLQAVTNGLLAPGVWTGPNIGIQNANGTYPLNTGDTLTAGFFVYAPPVATQSASARSARQSPVIQVACKFAGAIHSVNVIMDFVR